MKNQLADWEQEKIQLPEKFLCLCCRQQVVKDNFWFSSGFCRSCNSIKAEKYGIGLDDVGAAFTAYENLNWYKERMPPKEGISDIQYIRLLLIAAGMEIKGITDFERKGAAQLKERFSFLGESMEKIQKRLESVVNEIA